MTGRSVGSHARMSQQAELKGSVLCGKIN